MNNTYHKTRLSPEFKTLIACSIDAHTDLDIATIRKYICNGIDWNQFISLMLTHRLCGPVHKTLKIHFQNDIPHEVFLRISTLNLENIKKSLTNSVEAIVISKAFKNNGIDHLFLKGICLSQLLYKNPGFRHSGDIDLIIPQDKIKKTGKILESYGYSQAQSQKKISDDNMKLIIKLSHHLKYKSKKTNSTIELHWRLSSIQESCPITFEELFAQKRYVTINTCKLPVPGEIHTLVHLIWHGSQHIWKRLFWLKDIGDLINTKRTVDDLLLYQKTKKYGLNRPMGVCFFLLNMLFGIKIPEPIIIYIQKDKQISLSIRKIIYLYNSDEGPLSILISHFHRLFQINNYQYTFLYIKHFVLGKKHKKLFNPDHKSIFLSSIKKIFLLNYRIP